MRKSIGIPIIFAVILSVFCSPLAAQTSRPIYLYSLENSGVDHGPLHVFSVNASTGALTEVPGSPFTVGSGPVRMVVDPSGRFVYVINSNSNDITGFSVDASTGTLTPLPGSPFSTGTDPITLAVDPTGRFLYVFSWTVLNSVVQTADIYIYTIDSLTGVLTAATGSPIPESNAIPSIALAPNGNYAFLTQTLSNPLVGTIDSVDFSSGLLTDVGSFGNEPHLAYFAKMEPTGKFLYTFPAGEFSGGFVSAFTFDPSKPSLTEIQGSPFSTGPFPDDIEFDPLGKTIYVPTCDATCSTFTISAFAIDSETGALTPVPGSPFAAGMNVQSMVVDPTGHFAYAASTTPANATQGYATVLGYSIDASSGALTALPGTPWTDSLLASSGNRLAISYGPIAGTDPAPMISSLSPPSATAGEAGFTLQVNGVNYVPGAVVYFGGQARDTTVVSSTQLNANILSSDIANGGTGIVYVFNPLPGGGASTSIEFTVFNPSPTVSSINPNSVVAAGTAFTLTVNGSNFVTSSIVSVNGSARSTTYVSPIELTAAILATDVASPGAATIAVTNPPNGVAGGGTSGPITLTILPNSTLPTVGSLSPASATAGGPAFSLSLTGTGFVPSSQVSFNLNNVATTYVSSTDLQATIPASAIVFAGNPYVIVTNPGGVISVVTTFAVNNPPPSGGSVSPPSIPAGTPALTLNVSGMNFTQGSVVLVNGSSRVTTYISTTLLQATLLPSDLSQGGTLNITVMNPSPGGGTTAAISFVVADYAVTAPTAPTSVAAGLPGTFALTVGPSIGTFSNPVTFSASGLPAGASASFSPSATVTPGTTTQHITLSISTTAHSLAVPHESPRWPRPSMPSLYAMTALLALMGLGLLAFGRRTPHMARQLLLVLLIVTAVGLVACGGAGGGTTSTSSSQVNPASGTPTGTYTILVTATSGSVTHSSTVTLTVM